MTVDVENQIADVLRRCHIIQQWVHTYWDYLPPHVILFFGKLLLNISRQILQVARTIQEVTGLNYLT